MVVREPGKFSLLLGDTRTGRIHSRIPFKDIKWGQRLNNPGPVSATIRPHDALFAKMNLRQITTTVRNFIGVDYDGEILEAGPIWKRKYDPKSRSLNISGLGMWSMFDHRTNILGTLLDETGPAVAQSSYTVTRNHLGSIAAEIIRISIQDNPWDNGTAGNLPISLPVQQAGTAHTRTYWGYDMAKIGSDLRELTGVQNGPDLRFRPRYKEGADNFVEWVFEHGKTDLLKQTGPDWFWTTGMEDSPVLDFGVEQDGSQLASRFWVTGAGQKTDIRVAHGDRMALVLGGFPYTDSHKSESTVTSDQPLFDHAARFAEDYRLPWDTWTIQVRADADPRLGVYLPGDWAQVRTPEDHPILQDNAMVRVRVLAVSGGSGNTVDIEVAPVRSWV